MKNCSFCGAENEDAAVFCEECGKTFYKKCDKKCDKCGAENKITAKFCNKCGARFVAPNTICYTATEKIKSTWVNENSISHDFEDGNGYIVLKDGGVCIGEDAFRDCAGLISITIPNSVTSIGAYAFSESGLLWITIPNSVTEIGKNAFGGCSRLIIVNFNATNCTSSNPIFEYSSLETLNIGKNVKIIPDSAFSNCSRLTSINIPDSVMVIGCGAFSNCSGLTSVTIGNSVKLIGYGAFSNCSGLTSINIPDSVSKIYCDAFNGCIDLSTIFVAQANSIYDSRDNCNAIIETATNTLIAGCKNTIIPNSVTTIGNYAFKECGLTSIVIPDSVTVIGERAFYGCKRLYSITIPKSVTKIECCAFEETSWVDSQPDGILYLDNWLLGIKGYVPDDNIVINEGTIGIASEAFSDSNLRTVILPASLLYIGDNPFCWHSCNVISHNNSYIVENNLLLTKDKSRLIACLSLDFIVKIPNETIHIDNHAFSFSFGQYPPYFICINNEILNNFYYGHAKFIVPNYNIELNLMMKGVKDSSIIVGDVFIDEYGAIYSEGKTKLICYPDELNHKEYHIIEGCKTIMESAFIYKEKYAKEDGYYISGNNIDVIHFPESLETIEKNGLQGCSCLKAIKYPKQRELFIKNLLQSYSDAYKSHSELVNIMQPELQSE